jgi:hypothetical protein
MPLKAYSDEFVNIEIMDTPNDFCNQDHGLQEAGSDARELSINRRIATSRGV